MAGRNRVPLVVAVVVGVIAVFAVRAATSGSSSSDTGAKKAGGDLPKGCVTLNVAASSEKAALLQAIADDYAKDDGDVAGKCARVVVRTKASGGATTALARGWDEKVDGPRPDVWTPASTSWTALLRYQTTSRDLPDLVGEGKPPSIARTPLTIAMPKPMAETLGWPSKPIGWGDVLALAKDPQGWARYGKPYGAFKLGKTNPNFSTSGLNATIGAYFAATQRSSDLTAKDLADPKVLAYVKAVESSVVHYGDTTLTFLSNLQKADDRGQGLSYVSAVTVEEKSVWDYNQGNPTGDPKTLDKHRKPRTPLVAIYPKEGTLFSDNPFVTLKADWVTDAKRAVAADFLSYVQSGKAQKRFTDAAFRDFEGKPGPLVNPSEGLLPAEPKAVIGAPAPAVLAGIKDSWEKLRKRARVLLVLDVSGSMGDPVGSTGETKLELAKKAAAKAVGQLAPDDELSLWIFSTQQDGQKPYRQLVPFGPARANLTTVQAKIRDLQPDGGTGLYATVRAASKALVADYKPSLINAIVVLTDGRNEFPADNNIASLVDELNPEDIDRAVRVFPIAYGEDADLGELTKIADASRAAAYDASDPASIDNVLTAVLSNF
ncbi:MAG: Ca-activated chloride channel [Actinomycetota bacterium]|jgi:Ca-activated chloride channel family protein|nr:Ca-activated chloride channel [Actinomycetota bacterium]